MINRHFRISWVVLILLGSSHAVPQEAASRQTSDLQKARVLLQFGREEIVREDLRLTAAEAGEFWPVYDRYQSEMREIRDRYSNLVTAYIKDYRAGTVTEGMADTMTTDYLQIQRDILRVREKYWNNFRNALPPRKAARFYQLENKMDTELELQLSLLIPLIDPV